MLVQLMIVLNRDHNGPEVRVEERRQVLEPGETVAREVALFKLAVDGAQRAEVMQLRVFRAKVVDVTKRSVIVEVTGTTDKVDVFERVVRPFGLVEMMRTGEIAIPAGAARPDA